MLHRDQRRTESSWRGNNSKGGDCGQPVVIVGDGVAGGGWGVDGSTKDIAAHPEGQRYATEERAHALARLRRALQVCSRTKSLIQVYTRTTTSCVYFHTNFLGILSYQTHQAGAQVCTCTAVLFKCGSKPFKSWELQSAQNCPGAQKMPSFYQGTACVCSTTAGERM